APRSRSVLSLPDALPISAPLADAARFEARDLKGLLGAEDSLLERDGQVIAQVGPALRAAPRAAPRRTAKEGVELLEDVGEGAERSEEHTSELQSLAYLVC